MTKLVAIRERVILKRDNPDTKIGLIIIPDCAEKPAGQGVVIEVLPNDDGIEIGDTVVFHQYSGQEINVDGEDYTVTKLENLLCKVV